MDNLSFELETLIFKTCTFVCMQNKQILGHDIIVGRTRAEYNSRRQKLSNFRLTSQYLMPESLALQYSCFTPPHERKRAALVTPLFSPLCPQHSSQSPSPTPNHGKPLNLVLRRSGGPHTPTDLHSSPWNPQLPTHHFTGAASATGLSTAPDLLDRHHGPPHRICLTGTLVHHSVGPSLTPSSAPSLALHTSPRPPQQICLTESTVQRAR